MTKCKYWKKDRKQCSLVKKKRFLGIYGNCHGTGKITVWDDQASTSVENCSFKKMNED